ncbi:hypothetical protein [Plantactinospora sp. WMMB782]|uniref:hypothetical protein n=1 Tax=Plantactinospora sp. WMMB782 TaxID=3404121 RepID=UPI003B92AF15
MIVMTTNPASLSVASLPVGDTAITISTPGAGGTEIVLAAPAGRGYPQHATDALVARGFRLVGVWENYGCGPDDPGVWYVEAKVAR